MLHAVVTQIAKMLADNRLPAAHQAEGIFHLRAEAQHWRDILKSFRQRNGVRHITPRAAKHCALLVQDRIIHALQNVAVMQQKTVGDIAQVIQRLIIAQRGGFTAEIPGSHHQRARAVVHQQMLQRAGGQHHADAIQARRNVLRQFR